MLMPLRTHGRKTATDLGKRGHDPLYGQGLVNVAAAVGLDDEQPD